MVQLMSEITVWCREGYVCDSIWDRLRTHVNPELLPGQTATAPIGEEISLELSEQLRNILFSPEQLLMKRTTPSSSNDKPISCRGNCQENTKSSLTPVNLKCVKDYAIPTEEGL